MPKYRSQNLNLISAAVCFIRLRNPAFFFLLEGMAIGFALSGAIRFLLDAAQSVFIYTDSLKFLLVQFRRRRRKPLLIIRAVICNKELIQLQLIEQLYKGSYYY